MLSRIRQLQDLQLQLDHKSDTIRQLEAALANTSSHHGGINPSKRKACLPLDSRVRPRYEASRDFEIVRRNMRKYGRKIFRSSLQIGKNPERVPAPQEKSGSDVPSYDYSMQLIQQFFSSTHHNFPVKEQEKFLGEVEDYYAGRHTQSLAWTAFLFAVLACGTLQLQSHRPQRSSTFIDIATRHMHTYSDGFDLDWIRAALLASIYYQEVGSTQAASVWIAASVQIAQSLGLHREDRANKAETGDASRMLWWSVFAWER